MPVDIGCQHQIKSTFQTLLLRQKLKQQDLADYLGHDKGYISRICSGVQIPPLRIRLKIAGFLEVDSSLIWRPSDFSKENSDEN